VLEAAQRKRIPARSQILQIGVRSQNPFAGWSSPVARQAHNLKVVSSNLAPATKLKTRTLNEIAGFHFVPDSLKNRAGQPLGNSWERNFGISAVFVKTKSLGT
jgi:hypothetical protein